MAYCLEGHRLSLVRRPELPKPKCENGHLLKFVDKPVHNEDERLERHYNCCICYKKGKFLTGAFRCEKCRYTIHTTCGDPNYGDGTTYIC